MFGAFWPSSCRADPCTSLAYNKWQGQDNSTVEDTTIGNGCSFDNSTKKQNKSCPAPLFKDPVHQNRCSISSRKLGRNKESSFRLHQLFFYHCKQSGRKVLYSTQSFPGSKTRATSGREASTEYEPCWPGKGFSPHHTGLNIFFCFFKLNVFRVGHPAKA